MSEPQSDRTGEHLFISYATEDAALARWLTLKLTALGYRVWCDQFKLLGGENYPTEIDRAIKEGAFRVLGIISSHSIHKENPTKERTLALSIGRARKIDFLIPLNAEGIPAHGLHWMVSDLTYVPFMNWSLGLRQLLEKLESISAPRPLASGREFAGRALRPLATVRTEPERLVTNRFPFVSVPEVVHGFNLTKRLGEDEARRLRLGWPYYAVGDGRALAFEPPPAALSDGIVRQGGACWPSVREIEGLDAINVVKHLLRASIYCHATRRGLPFEPRWQRLYFPLGALPDDKLRFTDYGSKATWCAAAGERTHRGDQFRYHLAPEFTVRMTEKRSFAAELRVRLHLTDMRGAPLERRQIPARRKAVTRNWWNSELLKRQMAVIEFLEPTDGRLVLGVSESTGPVLAASPITALVSVGIDEGAFRDLGAEPNTPPPEFDDEDDEREE